MENQRWKVFVVLKYFYIVHCGLESCGYSHCYLWANLPMTVTYLKSMPIKESRDVLHIDLKGRITVISEGRNDFFLFCCLLNSKFLFWSVLYFHWALGLFTWMLKDPMSMSGFSLYILHPILLMYPSSLLFLKLNLHLGKIENSACASSQASFSHFFKAINYFIKHWPKW